MLQEPLAMTFWSLLFQCLCWMSWRKTLERRGSHSELWGKWSQSLLMTHYMWWLQSQHSWPKIIRFIGAFSPTIHFFWRRKGNRVFNQGECVWGIFVFFFSKVPFPCEFFLLRTRAQCLFVLKLWTANNFPLPFFTCKCLHVFSGNRSPPLWAAFTTWLLCPLPRTSVMSYNMAERQGFEVGRWVWQRVLGVQSRLAT